MLDYPYTTPKQTVHLHLALDIRASINQKERRILQQYGKMNDGISRDILVPSTMTLHGLHYAIQQLLGWQNGHLHHFELPHKIFQQLVDNRFQRWGELCGVYFRFPTDDTEDLYWDDDYDGSQQFSTWLRRRYTGPYEYDGQSEGFLQCYKEVLDFYKRFPVIDVQPSFADTLKHPQRSVISKRISPQKATLDEVFRSIFFESSPTELLERLRLHDLLFLAPPPPDYALPDRQTLPLPVTKELWYYYDYGDDWKVRITLVENSPLAQENPQVYQQEKPICIQRDGVSLMDDVGGIHGYCDFLWDLHHSDSITRQELRKWASFMGWTGRLRSPVRML